MNGTQRAPRRTRRAGYTLIDVMIVTVIISVLATMAVNRYQLFVARAKRPEAVMAFRAIAAAQREHLVTRGKYAGTFDALGFRVEGGSPNLPNRGSGPSVQLPPDPGCGSALLVLPRLRRHRRRRLQRHHRGEQPSINRNLGNIPHLRTVNFILYWNSKEVLTMKISRLTIGLGLVAVVGLLGLIEASASPFSMFFLADDLGNRVSRDSSRGERMGERRRRLWRRQRRWQPRATTGDSDKGDSDKGDSDKGDSDKGDSDKGDSDKGDSDKGDSDKGDSDAARRRTRSRTRRRTTAATPTWQRRLWEEQQRSRQQCGRGRLQQSWQQ